MNPLFAPIQLSETKEVATRVQLLRTGKFEEGALVLDEVILASLKKNFDAKVRGYTDGKLPIDYFHEGWKEAAGWISALYLEANGTELWADVQWTPKAMECIGGGEIRYLSVEFSFDYQDNESNQKFGPTLFGAGLTNRPFVKGMKPVVQLSEKGGKGNMELKEALEKIQTLSTQVTDLETKLSESVKASDSLKLELEAAKKKAVFDKMLSEGKVVEAQREAYLANDMVTFAERAKPVNTIPAGTKAQEAPVSSGKTAAAEILELAEKLVSEGQISLSAAISKVRHEKPELVKRHADELRVQSA